MADDFNIKAAPTPKKEPTRDKTKFRRLVIYADIETGKKLDRIELNLIDYDSNDPEEKNVVGKSVNLELRASAKGKMGAAFFSALKTFISDWMTSRDNEPE